MRIIKHKAVSKKMEKKVQPAPKRLLKKKEEPKPKDIPTILRKVVPVPLKKEKSKNLKEYSNQKRDQNFGEKKTEKPHAKQETRVRKIAKVYKKSAEKETKAKTVALAKIKADEPVKKIRLEKKIKKPSPVKKIIEKRNAFKEAEKKHRVKAAEPKLAKEVEKKEPKTRGRKRKDANLKIADKIQKTAPKKIDKKAEKDNRKSPEKKPITLLSSKPNKSLEHKHDLALLVKAEPKPVEVKQRLEVKKEFLKPLK